MEIVLRTTVVFFFLLLLVRSMGKRELAEMSAFELVVLVTIGDIVQQGVTQEDMSITGAVLAASTMGVLAVGLSYITYRWRKTGSVLVGIPVVIVRDGKLLEDAMRLERVPEDEVKEAARQQGIDDLRKIRVGIMEADGKFSFIRTDEKEPQDSGGAAEKST